MKTSLKLIENVVGLLAVAYSLGYGIIAYSGAAADVMGPGGPLAIYRNPVHHISNYYMRVHGANTLFLVLTFYLFCRGSKARKRVYTKALLVGWAAAIITMIRVSLDKDFESTYRADEWRKGIIISILHPVYFVSLLKNHPVKIVQETPLRNADRIGLVLLTAYLGYFAVSKTVGGPGQLFFPLENTEEGAFSLEMRECAQMMGSSLLAPLTMLLTGDAYKMPKFLWQCMCFHMILLLPLFYSMASGLEEYGNPSAFIPLTVSVIGWLTFGFQRLGAFDKVQVPSVSTTLPAKVASKAA